MFTVARGVSVLTATLVATIGSTAAHARLITFEYSGVVTSVFDEFGVLGGAVNVGDPFVGTYTFDSEAPDSHPDPRYGIYSSSRAEMATTIGAVGFSASGLTNRIVVANNTPADRISLGSFLFASGGFQVSEFGATLYDVTGSALSDDALPLSPPTLELFDSRELIAQGSKNGIGFFDIRGMIVTLTPEPSSILLFLSMTAAPLLRRR